MFYSGQACCDVPLRAVVLQREVPGPLVVNNNRKIRIANSYCVIKPRPALWEGALRMTMSMFVCLSEPNIDAVLVFGIGRRCSGQ